MKAKHPSYSTLRDIELKLDTLQDKPMMIFWGDDDFCFSPEFRKEWMKRFPDATVHAWSDVGHYVMEDAPDRVIEQLRPFLSS